MNPQIELNLRKIERTSRVLRTLFTVLFIPVTVIAVAITVSVLAGWTAHIKFDGQTFVPSELVLPARLYLSAIVVAMAVVLAKGLFHLRRLMGNYSRREIFTLDSARQIRQFGVTCVLFGVIKIAGAFLPLMLASDTHRAVNLNADAMIIGVVIIGISWFAEMAAALREENDLTV